MMGLRERVLRALVKRELGAKEHAGLLLWVSDAGTVRELGPAGVADLEGVAWGLDVAHRLAGGRGANVGVGDRRRLTGLRVVAHRWARAARSRAGA